VSVLRAALGGRRYELFDTADAFKQFAAESEQALRLARPVIEKEQVRLAVENHKDWRVADLLGMLKRLDSPQVGVCIDTGNSIALLEEPHQVVEAYAPLAFSTHIKDMGIEPYDDGFLLSEVPLGQGYLDLPRIMTTIRKARPEVRFNLEMITRDPLPIPVLSKKYWATLAHVPATDLADMLAAVKRHGQKPLPRVGQLSKEERLRVEEGNVQQCLEHAARKLPA
jgi:sugar phosphate isomerase/epimerase